MSSITSPPDVAERATAVALIAACASIVDPPSDRERELAADTAQALLKRFEHLDVASIIDICEYFGSVFDTYCGLVTSRQLPDRATVILPVARMALDHAVVLLAEDMLDDLQASREAMLDQTLASLRAKLQGEADPCADGTCGHSFADEDAA